MNNTVHTVDTISGLNTVRGAKDSWGASKSRVNHHCGIKKLTWTALYFQRKTNFHCGGKVSSLLTGAKNQDEDDKWRVCRVSPLRCLLGFLQKRRLEEPVLLNQTCIITARQLFSQFKTMGVLQERPSENDLLHLHAVWLGFFTSLSLAAIQGGILKRPAKTTNARTVACLQSDVGAGLL